MIQKVGLNKHDIHEQSAIASRMVAMVMPGIKPGLQLATYSSAISCCKTASPGKSGNKICVEYNKRAKSIHAL